MICSSLYLLVLMSVILQVDGLRCLYGGMTGRGQVNVWLPNGVKSVQEAISLFEWKALSYCCRVLLPPVHSG